MWLTLIDFYHLGRGFIPMPRGWGHYCDVSSHPDSLQATEEGTPSGFCDMGFM